VPSVRSDAGYRLYDPADAARLAAIVAMQELGLSLEEIRGLLETDGAAMREIVARRIAALDEEIRARERLRGRLEVARDLLAAGVTPALSDWVDGLAFADASARHLDAAELRAVLANLQRSRHEWRALVHDVRAEMALGTPPDAPATQRLARRWMDVSIRGVDGDLDRLKRWIALQRERPGLRSADGIDPPLLAFIGAAIEHRLRLLATCLDAQDLQRLDKTLEPEFAALNDAARRALDDGALPGSARARTLAQAWQALLLRMARGDAALLARVLEAYERQPALYLGSPLEPEVRAFLRRSLDPHVA